MATPFHAFWLWIPRMVAAGARALVAGTSSVYSSEGTIEANTERVRGLIAEGLAQRAGRSS